MKSYNTFSCQLGILAGLFLLHQTGVAAADDWGGIKGRIVWGGDGEPKLNPITVDKDQDHCLSKGPIPNQDWVVNKENKGIRWTYVWLAPEPDPADPKKKLPIHPSLKAIKEKEVVLDQPCCMFEPHALAIREGQILIAKNSAPIAHNIRWTGGLKNAGGNLIIPAKGEHVIKDLRADRIPVTVACDIHKWMKAWVRVFDHPYFAVTDENGNFEIKNAPAGPCRLIVWHESVGWRGGKEGRNGERITIKAGETSDMGKLDLKPSE